MLNTNTNAVICAFCPESLGPENVARLVMRQRAALGDRPAEPTVRCRSCEMMNELTLDADGRVVAGTAGHRCQHDMPDQRRQ